MPYKQIGVVSGLIFGLLVPLFLADRLDPKIILFIAVLLLLCLRSVAGRIGFCMVLGMLISSYQLNRTIDRQLDESLEGRDVLLVGRVLSRPNPRAPSKLRYQAPGHSHNTSAKSSEARDLSLRFEIRVDNLQDFGAADITPKLPEQVLAKMKGEKVRLSWRKTWRDVDIPRAGQTWQLLVRLKRPRGFVNPQGFDYQAWLLAKNIMATGYVKGRAVDVNTLLAEGAPTVFERARGHIEQRLFSNREEPLIAVLRALLIGDRTGISREQWNVFRQTGTSHLMAISGLHIGIVALFSFWCGRRLLCPLVAMACTNLPIQTARIYLLLPALVSILASGFYAGLSGFSTPTQRAWMIVVLVHFALALGRRCDSLYVLLCVAAIVLVLNPLAATQAGFWLSFGAVFFLIYCFAYIVSRRKRVIDLIKAQAAVFVGLSTILSALSIPLSLISPLTNIVAVPVMSLLIIPLLFCAAFLSLINISMGVLALDACLYITHILWQLLVFFSDPKYTIVLPHSAGLVLLGALASLFLLSAAALQLRLFGLSLAVMCLMSRSPEVDGMRVVMLDVGQGLSVVFRSQQETLVYDTGARFSQDFDIGSAVLVPYLRSHGVGELKYLVVSHADNDHAGGLESLAKEIAIESLLFNSPFPPVKKQLPCLAGQQYRLGNWHVDVLWPPAGELSEKNSNNDSCVLLFEWGEFAMLFTGDIEKGVEKALLRNASLPQGVDVLLAPHHGSRSSSSQAFIEYVAPKIVLFSAGYNNPYGHPASKVLDRYQRMEAQQLRTDMHGAITINVEKGGLTVGKERMRAKRPWYADGD